MYACLLHARLLHDSDVTHISSIDRFVYNNSVIEHIHCFGTSFFGPIDHLTSSVIKSRPNNSVPKHCIRSITYKYLKWQTILVSIIKFMHILPIFFFSHRLVSMFINTVFVPHCDSHGNDMVVGHTLGSTDSEHITHVHNVHHSYLTKWLVNMTWLVKWVLVSYV